MNKILVSRLIGVALAGSAAASDDDRYSAGTAAATGASTQVLASTGLDYATNSSDVTDSPSQTILKRALVGAATGAVATKMSYEPKANFVPENVSDGQSAATEVSAASALRASGKKSKKPKKEKGHRPPGWDKGKKIGWDGSDVPPGHAKKKN